MKQSEKNLEKKYQENLDSAKRNSKNENGAKRLILSHALKKYFRRPDPTQPLALHGTVLDFESHFLG